MNKKITKMIAKIIVITILVPYFVIIGDTAKAFAAAGEKGFEYNINSELSTNAGSWSTKSGTVKGSDLDIEYPTYGKEGNGDDNEIFNVLYASLNENYYYYSSVNGNTVYTSTADDFDGLGNRWEAFYGKDRTNNKSSAFDEFIYELTWLRRSSAGMMENLQYSAFSSSGISDEFVNALFENSCTAFVKTYAKESGLSDSKEGVKVLFNTLYEFAGKPTRENTVTVYKVWIKDKAGGNGSVYWYTGCDYSIVDNMFHYYVVAATPISAQADDLAVMCFKSPYYIHCDIDSWESQANNVPGVENVQTRYETEYTFEHTSEGYLDDVGESLVEVARAMIITDNGSYYKQFDANGNLTAESKEAIKRFNSVLRVKNDTTANDDEVKIVEAFSSYYLKCIGSGSGTTNNDCCFRSVYVTKGDKVLCKTSPLSTNNPAFADFGNGEAIQSEYNPFEREWGKNNTSNLVSLICEILNDITNYAIDKQGSDTSFKIDEYLDNLVISYDSMFDSTQDNNSPHDIIAELMDGLVGHLQTSIRNMSLNTFKGTIPSIEGINLNDSSYNIVRDVITYNYTQLTTSGSWANYYSVGDTLLFIHTRTSSYYDSNNPMLTGDNPMMRGASIGDYWNRLSEYEKWVLSSEYSMKLEEISDKGINDNKILRWLKDYYELSLTSKMDESNLPEQITLTAIEFEDIKKVVKEYDESLYINTGSPLVIARQASVVTKYLIATSLYQTDNSVVSEDDLYYLYNYNLQNLTKSNFTYEGTTTNWYPQYPHKLNRMPEDSYLWLGNNREKFLNLLWNISFAFEALDDSEYALTQHYTSEQIGDWFTSLEASNMKLWLEEMGYASAWESQSVAEQYNFDGNGFAYDLFQCVIELHDMCEFLGIGIGDWNESIDKYLKLYNNNESFFNSLRNNNYIFSRANTGEITKEEPLGKFFSIAENKVSDQWAKGFSLSALYVPMETNVYDASSIRFVEDSDWVPEFYYKYGFFRKALYINTDNSALINQFVSGQKSGTRVATLRDLLNYERDIVLTVDPNFYNADEINSVVSKLDYTNVRNSASAEDTSMGWESVGNWIGELFDLSPSQVLKTAGNYYYSEALQEGVTKLDASLEEEEENYKTSMLDAYLLNNVQILGDSTAEVPIESAIDADEYSVKQSYAVVSAVYRCNELYNLLLSGIASDNAIFKSSKGVCSVPGTSSNDWRAVLNYAMLANLEEQMKNDSATAIDLDSPIFCDVFGNILTESGLVIIPAACNATLCGQTWNPYTVGWSEYYNNGNRIKVEELPDDVYSWLLGKDYEKALANESLSSEEAKKENGGGYFEISKNGDLILRTTALTSNNLSAIVTWSNLNKNSDVISNLFFSDAYFSKTPNLFGPRLANMIVEVLRGAPIENIDYSFEGLSGKVDISKYGVFMAYKLEEIVDSVISGTNGNAFAGSGNSMVTMPNLAFVSGIEYIVLYVFKIVFAVFIVGLVISLYLDAVKNHLGIKSVGKFIVTCVMTIVSLTLVPNLISWSYYEANKSLLSDEVSYIMMLNYVKEFDGAEIGITSVRTPETETELFIRVEDVSVDWWDIIDDVLFNNSINTVTDLYESQLTDSSMAHVDKVQHKADGLYVDVNDVFNSTSIVYKPSSHVLENQIYNITYNKESGVSGANTMGLSSAVSFTSPYYVFLDQLIANVNEYNITGDVQSYSYSVGSNGHIMTYDIISPYLTSEEYLAEGYDILGLHKILNTTHKPLLYNFAFNQSDVDSMHRSSWWPGDNMPMEVVEDKVSELYAYARDFINMNQNVLGKVPDEVFLKVLALQLATKYNDLFGVTNSNAIEIINIDSRDLMRFLVADKGDIYKYYSYSFSRFVYEEAGGFGTVIMMFYTVVLWLTSMLKPILMVLLVALLIINVVGRKVLFRKESRCIEGYLIGAACLCLCNYAYAIMLKATMQLMSLGLGSTLTMLTAFVVQIAYVCGLIGICRIEVKDWKNNGFSEWQHIGGRISSGILHAQQLMAEKVVSRSNEAYRDSLNRNVPSPVIEHLRVADMIEREMQRVENGTYSTD
ncbi:MAG: hypothetical protein IKL53_01150 [Lachnospiraceae bacterium]|nr:hypothetical protein [Lachnospiraceae bacterium]